MKTFLLSTLTQTLLFLIDSAEVKKLLDEFMDKIEDYVINSENQIDDVVILALTAKIRAELAIPDNDDEPSR